MFSTLMCAIDGATALILAFYYMFIDNHYILPTSIGMWTSFFGIIPAIFYMTESPIWLLKKGHSLSAVKNIQEILSKNGLEMTEDKIYKFLRLRPQDQPGTSPQNQNLSEDPDSDNELLQSDSNLSERESLDSQKTEIIGTLQQWPVI